MTHETLQKRKHKTGPLLTWRWIADMLRIGCVPPLPSGLREEKLVDDSMVETRDMKGRSLRNGTSSDFRGSLCISKCTKLAIKGLQ